MKKETERKTLKKLSLKKDVISVLNKNEQANLQGGGFTTWGNCQTRFTCCVVQTSCALSTDCNY